MKDDSCTSSGNDECTICILHHSHWQWGALPLILINSNNNDWSEDVDEDMVVVKEELVW